jgi:hypothetical protein
VIVLIDGLFIEEEKTNMFGWGIHGRIFMGIG